MPATANRQIFTERLAAGFTPSIDVENGIIRNVKFLASGAAIG